MKIFQRLAFVASALVVGSPLALGDGPYSARESYIQSDTWSGFYAGVGLGGRWNRATWTTGLIGDPLLPNDLTTPQQNFDSWAGRAGGYLGYNWQVSNVVVGIEANLATARSEELLGFIPGVNIFAPPIVSGDTAIVRTGWDAALLLRGGVLVAPHMLAYVTGGVAFLNVEVAAKCSDMNTGSGNWCFGADRSESFKDTLTGWTIGGGLETKFGRSWIIRGEYRFADFGSVDHTFFASAPGDQVQTSTSFQTHTVTLGLAYKF